MENKYFIISPYESPAESRGTRNIVLANHIGESNHCTLVTTRFSHGKKRNYRKIYSLIMRNLILILFQQLHIKIIFQLGDLLLIG